MKGVGMPVGMPLQSQPPALTLTALSSTHLNITRQATPVVTSGIAAAARHNLAELEHDPCIMPFAKLIPAVLHTRTAPGVGPSARYGKAAGETLLRLT